MRQIANKWQVGKQSFDDTLAGLSARDKLALSALLVFLFFCLCFFAFEMHGKMQKQQSRFDNKIADYFWLRSQSSNIRADGMAGNSEAQTQPLSVQISNGLRQAGVNNPKVAQVGTDAKHVQLSFTQSSQAMLSRSINQLQNMGVTFKRLDVKQESDNSFIVQATVVKP